MAAEQLSKSSASSEIPLHEDIEKGTADADLADVRTSNKNRMIKEAAGLVLFFSMFALIEGIARMTTASNPGPDFDFGTTNGGTTIPGAVFLAGGVAEVIFGLGGIFLATYSLLFDVQHPKLTFVCAIIQSVLGWFVFLTYVVADPILRARFEENTSELLSDSEFRSLVILGEMFGGVTFCYALQGGQFIAILNLASAQKGDEWNKAKTLTRGTVWAINLLVAAFSTIYVGIVLASKGFGEEMGPFVIPPHLVWYPSLSIVTGILMLVFGALCLVASRKASLIHGVAILFPIVVTMMFANFSWVFGRVEGFGPPLVGALQHIGLILSAAFLPAYHAVRTHRAP